MKTIIGLSNFSFNNPNFSSFEELKGAFMSLQNIKNEYTQAKISFAVGNDIVDYKGFGLSVNQQIRNFEFGSDVGIKTAFHIRLHREYLNGFDMSLTTEELKDKSLEPPDVENKVNYIIYTPVQVIANCASFKDSGSFAHHYEKILGEYPIDNESYYERVVSHFTNLIYHTDCERTLDRVTDGFCNYSIAFTTCLRALNSFSPTAIPSTKEKVDYIDSLTPFDCTEEGSSHSNFKYDFSHNGKNVKNLNCQYHLKPSGNNRAGDGSFNHKRLYFGFFPLDNNEWRVAVASIGPHINKKDSTDRYAKPKR